MCCVLCTPQTWAVISSAGPGQPWPLARASHSSCSLHDPDSNPVEPSLMMQWGAGEDEDGVEEALSDAWIFTLRVKKFQKVHMVHVFNNYASSY